MNFKMARFALTPIDFLVYITFYFFCNSSASLTQSDSLDPDINFNTGKTPCNYFTENQFNEMLLHENYSGADFSLLQLNIRSLPLNLNSLTDLFIMFRH